jgi:hypothetical protein
MTLEGHVENGQIILDEAVALPEGMKVRIELLSSSDLNERGIDQRQAADLRQRLKPFAEDWDRPEMDAYDAP